MPQLLFHDMADCNTYHVRVGWQNYATLSLSYHDRFHRPSDLTALELAHDTGIGLIRCVLIWFLLNPLLYLYRRLSER